MGSLDAAVLEMLSRGYEGVLPFSSGFENLYVFLFGRRKDGLGCVKC